MRSGGFPCRGGCDVTFVVRDQNSMESLLAASAKRTEHEIAQHGYTHVRLDEQPARQMSYSRPVKKPAPTS